MTSTSNHLLDLDGLADARNVPTPPAAAMRILELRSNPNTAVRDVARAVEADAALTTKILATANSAYYRRGNEVTSVERAISMIGISSVMTIALAFSVASSIPTSGVVGGVSMSAYWSHSVLTSASARAVALELSPGLVDEAFLVGLLSNMGKVVLALAAEDVYRPVAEAAAGWPSLDDERAALGFSSGDATAHLLRAWSMPDVLADAIEALGQPTTGGTDSVSLLAGVACVGAEIAAFYINGGDATALRLLTTKAVAAGLDGPAIDKVLDGVQRQSVDLASQLGVAISAEDYGATIAQARAQLVEQALNADLMLHEERGRRVAVEAEARQDALTGLPNRRSFDEHLERNLKVRLRAAEPLHKPMGVILLDIDHFKSVNDTYGHDVGDDVLKELARAVAPITRGDEMIARTGGEEFTLLAPTATREELTMAAERLRLAIAAIEIPLRNGDTLRLTASFGVALLHVPTSLNDGAPLVKAADEALYQAKQTGRNRVVVSDTDLG